MSKRGSRPILQDSFIADEALTQYQAVVYSGTAAANVGHITNPAAALDVCAGIVQDDASASGDVVRVIQIGKSLAIAGEADNLGAAIGIHDTDGRVSSPAGFASGDGYVGYYEEPPTASGDIVTAYINVQELIR